MCHLPFGNGNFIVTFHRHFSQLFQLQESQKSCWRAQNLTIPLSLLAKNCWWILSLLLAIPSKLPSPRPRSGTAKRKLTLVETMRLSFLTVSPQTWRSSASSWQSSAFPPSACASAASPSTTRASTDWPTCTPTAKLTRWALSWHSSCIRCPSKQTGTSLEVSVFKIQQISLFNAVWNETTLWEVFSS